MADLMLHLKVHLRNLFKEPLKMHKKATERTHMMLPLMVYLKVHLSVQLNTSLMVHLKAVQEGIFEVENKGALELTIELHLTIHLVVLLLVNKSAQNDSTKGFRFKEHCKIQKNVKKEMYFSLQLMIHLAMQSRNTPEGRLDGALKNTHRDLHKDAQKCAF